MEGSEDCGEGGSLIQVSLGCVFGYKGGQARECGPDTVGCPPGMRLDCETAAAPLVGGGETEAEPP